MTNQISKAREAYELLWPNIENEMRGAEGSEAEEMEKLWTLIGNALHDYGELLTTLSTVDAGRLESELEAFKHLSCGTWPNIYEAARTLHGIIGEKI